MFHVEHIMFEIVSNLSGLACSLLPLDLPCQTSYKRRRRELAVQASVPLPAGERRPIPSLLDVGMDR